MSDEVCPRCGNPKVVRRIVNDRFAAADPSGAVFDVSLQEPVLSCPACRMSWQDEATLVAMEHAYQVALAARVRAG